MNPKSILLEPSLKTVTGVMIVINSGTDNTSASLNTISSVPKMQWLCTALTTVLSQAMFPPAGQDLDTTGLL